MCRRSPQGARRVRRGDTVVAMLGGRACAKDNLEGCATLRRTAAARSPSASPYGDGFDAELAAQNPAACIADRRRKDRFDAAELDAQVAEWRKQGQRRRVHQCCFDILHPGHVPRLTQARAACDRLIVGLNSDASCRR